MKRSRTDRPKVRALQARGGGMTGRDGAIDFAARTGDVEPGRRRSARRITSIA